MEMDHRQANRGGLSARGAPIGKDHDTQLAILGCGLQGRAHLEAIKGEVPTLTHCRAYDIMPDLQAAYVAELRRQI